MKKLKTTLLMLAMAVMCAVGVLFAACGAKNVRLTFDTHGAGPVAEQTLKVGEEYTLPEPPAYEGFSFEGWYLDASYTGSPVTSGVADKDTTFHAKWEQMYLVSLDLDGGTIGGSSVAPKLYLKKGANISSALQAYVPEKAGYEFGDWFAGDSELSKSATMTESGISLTAHYKVGYTVQVYLQNLEDDGYTQGEDIKGFAYATANFTPAVSMKGFERVQNSNSLETLDLNDSDPSANVFRFYFDRRELAVVLDPNYPDGSSTAADRQEVTFRYGNKVELPNDSFRFAGYMLRGWAKTQGGEVEYASHAIESMLYGAEAGEPDLFEFSEDTMLFAVWTKGYTDMFGGSDCLYIFDETSGKIYLDRSGKYFEGTYTPSSKSFFFVDKKDRTISSGKINSDGTFVYYNEAMASLSFLRYRFPDGVVQGETLTLDAYNGLTYNNGLGRSKGTYTYEDGLYVVTFEDGILSGQKLSIRLAQTTSGTNVFLILNEADLDYGQMLMTFVRDGQVLSYTSVYALSLDGFGTATLNQGTSNASLSYYWEDDVLYLISGSSLYGTFKIIELQDGYGYVYYNAEEEGTYTADDGSTLSLDGLYSATYTKGATALKGYYASASSRFGADYAIVTFTASDGTAYTFLISAKEVTIPSEDEGSAPETTIERTFALRANGYAEYLYCALSNGSQVAYYAPMLVLNETEEGKATLYAYNAAREYVKVAVGTYMNDNGVYAFTVTESFEVDESGAELRTEPYDVTKIQACIFRIGSFTSNSGTFEVSYWLSVTLEGEDPTELDVKYTAANGDTLSLVAGFAIYKTTREGQEVAIAGSYSQTGTRIRLTVSSSSLYFEINEEDHSFLMLSGLLGSASELYNGQAVEDGATLTFDGKGNATYTKGEEEPIKGKVTALEETTVFGTSIYSFTANGLSFRFLLVSQSSRTYFARENTELTKEYVSEELGKLELDGFGFRARYTNVYNIAFDGNYAFDPEENAVLLTLSVNGSALNAYFDLKDSSFTMRGSEYGLYFDYNNQYMNGVVYELDGYGKLTVSRIPRDDEEGSELIVIANNGTYTAENDGYRLKYEDETGAKHEVFGHLGSYQISQTSALRIFIVELDEVVRVLVNENDWTVLTLDGFGNAVYIDNLGMSNRGQYVLITDSLFYFVTNDGSVANIYRYDFEKGSATPVSMHAQGYYTSDLESMLFTQYGFMIKDGTERYYYDVEDDEVTIYRQAPTADPSEVNEYGFIVIPFGKFDATKEYDEKTYYLSDGYSVNFNRTDGKDAEYPLTARKSDGTTFYYLIEGLSFTPSGSTFSTNAVVILRSVDALDATEKSDPVTKQGTIVRTRNEDGSYTTYVDFTGFRIEVGLTYHGSDNNIFEVSSLAAVTSALSMTYLQYSYLFDLFGLSPSSFGTLEIVTPIDVSGEAQDPYITVNFGARGDIPDTLNAPLKIEKCPFVYENSLFSLTVKGTDNYDYRFHFTLTATSYGNGFTLIAATRVETFENGGYKVEAERVVATESSNIGVGSFFSISIYEGEEEIELAGYLSVDGTYYLIHYTRDEDGTITATKYFLVTFTEKAPEEVEGATTLPPFTGATITCKEAKTYYTEDGSMYVDVFEEDNTIILLCPDAVSGSSYRVESSYDPATQTYTLTLGSTRTYKVKIENGKAVIELVPDPQG